MKKEWRIGAWVAFALLIALSVVLIGTTHSALAMLAGILAAALGIWINRRSAHR